MGVSTWMSVKQEEAGERYTFYSLMGVSQAPADNEAVDHTTLLFLLPYGSFQLSRLPEAETFGV